VAILKAFVATTLKDVLPFDWVDPLTESAKTYKFVSRPTYSYDAGMHDAWTASLELMEA
jgi:hypothetical protein